jgi:succinate-semialdehyde dehydrogenase/glutarate-semialdehyde dehydrogenase
LNTVLHKLAPAIAAGNPVILKPSEKTPLTAERIVAATERAGFPSGLVGMLQGRGSDLVPLLLSDPQIAYVAFTGSTAAGKAIQTRCGLRRTQMELGSIASTIVMADADLARAVGLCVPAAFRKAGQVCTSIQILLVQDSIYAAFRDAFVAATAALQVGDPRVTGTVVGPMISEASASKVDAMVDDAVARGATALLRGSRKNALLPPVVLEGGTPDMRLRCEEAFGPVVCLVPFATLDEAIGIANATPYGLSVGVFTCSIATAFHCAERIDAGAVHINQSSSSRVDVMPYGGVKASGFGREGPHHAVREMTVERLVTFSAGD